MSAITKNMLQLKILEIEYTQSNNFAINHEKVLFPFCFSHEKAYTPIYPFEVKGSFFLLTITHLLIDHLGLITSASFNCHANRRRDHFTIHIAHHELHFDWLRVCTLQPSLTRIHSNTNIQCRWMKSESRAALCGLFKKELLMNNKR